MTRAAAAFRLITHESHASAVGTIPGVAAGRWNNNSTINSTISQRRFADHPLFDRQTMTPCAKQGWKRRAIEILSAIGQQSGPLRRHRGQLAIAEKRWRPHRLLASHNRRGGQ